MNLQEMYQETLLAHNEQPHHFYSLKNPSHYAYGNNPICGDELTIYMQMERDILKEISFTGQGCAICRASASLMTLRLQGQSFQQAEKDAEQILQLLSNKTTSLPQNLGELEALMGVRKFPIRIKCATLAWHTFLKALRKEGLNPCDCDGKNSDLCCGCCC